MVLVGAGDTSALLLRYLHPILQHPVTILNRHPEKALQLAETCGGVACGFEEMVSVLREAEVVFSATGSPVPIITQEMVAEALQGRLSPHPLLLVDIAVPRDIAANVQALDRVQLYCIDDLKAIIEKNRYGREHAAEQAYEMIKQKSREVLEGLQSLHRVADTIRAYRGQIETIAHFELIKAKQQLSQGVDPLQVLDAFATAFTKKILHAPSIQLRQAGAEGRFELLHFAKQLFALPDHEAEYL